MDVKAFLTVVAILSFGVSVHAQPQAPVVWGEVRWLGINNVPRTFHPAVLMGDTLILAGAVPNQESPPRYCPGVTYSHNNGQTFSPWQCLDTMLFPSHQVYSSFFRSASRVFALVGGRLERSMNAGMSWSVVRSRPQHSGIYWGIAAGQQVITIEWYYPPNTDLTYWAAISDDGGDHWQTGIPLSSEMPQNVGFYDMAITQSHILLLGYQRVAPYPLAVSVGDRNGQNWSPFITMEGPSRINDVMPFILGDSTSETVMVLHGEGISSMYVMDLYLNRSTDGGLTWDVARNLSVGHSLNRLVALPELFSLGKLWGVVWEDFWNLDTTQWGVYTRLSANHGKDWYPAQWIGPDCPNMSCSSGQFVGHEVRLYWIDQWHDYATITGIMTEDTAQPELFLSLLPTDTIRAGDTLQFLAEASDNDTLSEVRLVVMDSADVRTTVLLSSMGNHQCQGSFVVPHTGLFRYRGEAEDFWENVASDPDTGWASFYADDRSSADDPFILQPTSYSVSVYPNPFNFSTQIEFTLPSTQRVSLRLYDVLGREVAQLVDGIKTAGEHRIVFDAAGFASGVYLCRMQAGKFSQTRKIVLLR